MWGKQCGVPAKGGHKQQQQEMDGGCVLDFIHQGHFSCDSNGAHAALPFEQANIKKKRKKGWH